MEALDPERLDVDVRRALENDHDAPLATTAFTAVLIAHGDAQALTRDQAADLFARVLFAPETVEPALLDRLDALYPNLCHDFPWRRARHVMLVLESLYYREKSTADAYLDKVEEALLKKLYS